VGVGDYKAAIWKFKVSNSNPDRKREGEKKRKMGGADRTREHAGIEDSCY